MAEDFAENFITAFNAAQEHQRRQQELEGQEEDRQIRKEYFKLAAKREELESRAAERQQAQSMYEFMETLPDRSTLEAGHAPVTFPGGMTLTPRTLEQVQTEETTNIEKLLEMQKRVGQETITLPGAGGKTVTAPANALPAVVAGEYNLAAGEAATAAGATQAQAERAHEIELQRMRSDTDLRVARLSQRAQINLAQGNRKAAYDLERLSRLAQYNLQLKLAGEDPVNTLPGEPEPALDKLRRTPTGAGIRTGGYGQQMPIALMLQYIAQAKLKTFNPTGEDPVTIAAQWANEDGWDIQDYSEE